MKKLTPINYNALDFNKFIYNREGIGTVKNGKQVIDTNIINIRNRFSLFQINSTNLENVNPITTYTVNTESACKALTSAQKNNELYCNLYSLYDSTSEHCKTFKKLIKDISKTKCPYCSLDTPSHIDHYLPRSVFPEYSVFSLNLIFSCSICNSGYKGDDYINAQGERLFINPYFDTFIETIPFLKCDIIINDSYPKFKFKIDNTLQVQYTYEYKIIKNHFDKLNLESRYLDQIVEEKFKRFKNRYIDKKSMEFKTITLQQLKDNITFILDGLDDLNINNWEKVFWESLKTSDNCLNLIVNKDIDIN